MKVLAGFSGKTREARFVDAIDGPASRLLLIGLGQDGDPDTVRRAAAMAVKKAEKTDVGSLVFGWACGREKKPKTWDRLWPKEW